MLSGSPTNFTTPDSAPSLMEPIKPNEIGAHEDQTLPSELVFHILSFIDAADLKKNVRFVSKQFKTCCESILSDSLKGKTMQFAAWQEAMIKKILHDLKRIDSHYEVTVLHQPQMIPQPQAMDRFFDFLDSNHFKLFAMITLYAGSLAIYYIWKMAGADTNKIKSPSLLIDTLLASIGVAILKYVLKNWEVPLQNANYQQYLLRDTDFTRLDGINHRNSVLNTLPNQPLNKSTLTTQSTVAQLRQAFFRAGNELVATSQQFTAVLRKEYTAKPHAKTISINDIPEPLQNYATHMALLWKAAKHEDLIDPLHTGVVIETSNNEENRPILHRPGRHHQE